MDIWWNNTVLSQQDSWAVINGKMREEYRIFRFITVLFHQISILKPRPYTFGKGPSEILFYTVKYTVLEDFTMTFPDNIRSWCENVYFYHELKDLILSVYDQVLSVLTQALSAESVCFLRSGRTIPWWLTTFCILLNSCPHCGQGYVLSCVCL